MAATDDLPSLAADPALGAIPRLRDVPAYAADPVHAASPAPDEETLTPDEELAIEHVFGNRPFTVNVEIPNWNMTVRYRVLDRLDLYLCDEGADQEAKSPSGKALLLGVHWLTRAVVDIGGEPPIGDVTEDTLGARYAYFLHRPEVVTNLLLAHYLRVQARFYALLQGEHVPKSPGTRAGTGGS